MWAASCLSTVASELIQIDERNYSNVTMIIISGIVPEVSCLAGLQVELSKKAKP